MLLLKETKQSLCILANANEVNIDYNSYTMRISSNRMLKSYTLDIINSLAVTGDYKGDIWL